MFDTAYMNYMYFDNVYSELYPITEHSIDTFELQKDLTDLGFSHIEAHQHIKTVFASNKRFTYIKGSDSALQETLERSIAAGIRNPQDNSQFLVAPTRFKLNRDFNIIVNYSPLLMKLEELFIGCITGFYFRSKEGQA